MGERRFKRCWCMGNVMLGTCKEVENSQDSGETYESNPIMAAHRGDVGAVANFSNCNSLGVSTIGAFCIIINIRLSLLVKALGGKQVYLLAPCLFSSKDFEILLRTRDFGWQQASKLTIQIPKNYEAN